MANHDQLTTTADWATAPFDTFLNLAAAQPFVLAQAVLTLFATIVVGCQLGRNIKQMRRSAVDTAVAALREVTTPFINNPDASRIFAKCVEQSEPVARADLARFAHMAYQFFKAAENVHYYRESGDLNDEVWAGWQNILHIYLASPGMQAYWAERRVCFSPAFQRWVDGLDKANRPEVTADALFGNWPNVAPDGQDH